MSERKCRWGILGTAGIGRKNWKAIALAKNAQLMAVASRSQQVAQQFVDECSREVPHHARPSALGSYESLLEREDIDVVYIPLPTAMRHEWVIRAARAGKHVLGEKPAANNADQLIEMLDACRHHGVQFMDGVMFMHSQRLELVRSLLNDPANVGQITRLASQFSFCGDAQFQSHNIRAMSQMEPYGCLGDLGWYCARIFLWVMQGQMPLEARARTLMPLQGIGSPTSVPGQFSAELLFPNGVSASFYNSFVTEHQQWVHISGSRGYLELRDFVLPYRSAELSVFVANHHFRIDNCTFHMEKHVREHSVTEYDAGAPGAQEVRMIERMSEIVLSGRPEPQWSEWSLKTQQILDACYQSSLEDGRPIPIRT